MNQVANNPEALRILKMTLLQRLRHWASGIKQDSITLWFACRHTETPWLVRCLCLFVVAYAFSPIDLIPDFIPVLGLLDDVGLLPLGILLVIKLTPAAILESSRAKAHEVTAKPTSKVAAMVVVAVWVLCALGFGYWLLGALGA